MTRKSPYKWTFTSRFRTNAFGWKGSRLACQRIKEAVSEIRKVTRKDPLTGAEGAIKLMEKLWPALQHIDTSSGALGTAVYNAMGVLVDVVVEAPADEKTRGKWLDRLWRAVEEDGVGFLDVLGEHWGDVCGLSEVASQWADGLLPVVQRTWEETKQGTFSYFRGTDACLSCLLSAGRHRELLDLIESTPGEEGKWFATAKSLGMLPLALKLAHQSPCEPKTLNRAARDFLNKDPEFALGAAMASLHWLSQGWGYEVTGIDVRSAYDYAMKAAEKLGLEEQVRMDIKKIVDHDASPGMFVKDVLERYLGL